MAGGAPLLVALTCSLTKGPFDLLLMSWARGQAAKAQDSEIKKKKRPKILHFPYLSRLAGRADLLILSGILQF